MRSNFHHIDITAPRGTVGLRATRVVGADHARGCGRGSPWELHRRAPRTSISIKLSILRGGVHHVYIRVAGPRTGSSIARRSRLSDSNIVLETLHIAGR